MKLACGLLLVQGSRGPRAIRHWLQLARSLARRGACRPRPPRASSAGKLAVGRGPSVVALVSDEHRSHELVVLVIEDVAVLDVTRAGGRRGIKGEQVLPGADAVGGYALWRPA